jgi:hypothetical protein
VAAAATVCARRRSARRWGRCEAAEVVSRPDVASALRAPIARARNWHTCVAFPDMRAAAIQLPSETCRDRCVRRQRERWYGLRGEVAAERGCRGGVRSATETEPAALRRAVSRQECVQSPGGLGRGAGPACQRAMQATRWSLDRAEDPRRQAAVDGGLTSVHHHTAVSACGRTGGRWCRSWGYSRTGLSAEVVLPDEAGPKEPERAVRPTGGGIESWTSRSSTQRSPLVNPVPPWIMNGIWNTWALLSVPRG